ncbi:MAG TPA: spore germination protein [Firmicutes bacterium]|jgi:stage V sporulation protein AF|nr:spore germination protein [Bacillota bacterium]HAA34429.1 spore germination protein [Bacillota bacterium]
MDISFDVVLREFKIGRKKVAFIFIDGFADSDIITLIMQTLLEAKQEEVVPNTLEKITSKLLPYGEISIIDNLEEAVKEVLAGPLVFLIDGEEKIIAVDTRKYPSRDPDEADIEKVTRGSRDGFVETLLFNVTLIRRRIRDPRLRTESFKLGRRSLTEVALLYIEDIVNPEILEKIRDKLLKIDVDGLPMAEKSVEEFITEGFWNPFPEIRYTERPDVAAVHLLEGHVCILVDTSPSVMIAPVTLFHHLQHAEEFRHNPIVGVYIRWVRILGVFISVFLVPLWLILVEYRDLLPEILTFIGPKESPTIPLFIQFILANLGLDLLRMASIHTPSPLATALGLVGALLIGDIAVTVGVFVPEVLLYISLVAIGVFSTPSWELSLANRLVQFFLLVLTGLFNIYGFIAGVLIIFYRLASTRSLGIPYLWPLLPLDIKALFSVLVRKPVPIKGFRPSILKTRDADTAPPGEK